MTGEIFRKRLELLRALMKSSESDSLLISRCDNFAWLTLGARNYITLNSTEGVCSILVTKDRPVLLLDNIENDRILEEELSDEILSEMQICTYNWWNDLERILLSEFNVHSLISDSRNIGEVLSPALLLPLRLQLCSEEIDTYREIGAICDSVLHEQILGISPDLTETVVQARVASAFIERGLEPVLVLVFGEESAQRYRHNLPREIEIGSKAFVSVCVRKKGLIASATRSVLFGQNRDYEELHKKVSRIDALAIANSIPGIKLDNLFDLIKREYATAGFPEEWKKHHQGGLAGYNAREVFANQHSNHVLGSGSVVAWNPTITGVKSEDTVVVTTEGAEIFTFPRSTFWPELEYEINNIVIRRPDIVVI